MKRVIKEGGTKLRCRLFGHKWGLYYGENNYCKRCHIEFMAWVDYCERQRDLL